MRFPNLILWAGDAWSKAAAGNVSGEMKVDGQTLTQNFEIKSDPRVNTTAADYAKQLELGLKIRDKLSETHNAIIQIREVRRRLKIC